MDRFVLISGCSGGGKSTLLSELKRRGYAVVEEPGRRIIAEELRGHGTALPWVDLAAFAKRAMETARRDRAAAIDVAGPVFFDRGLIDAAAALEHATGNPALGFCAAERYYRRVFLTPPWPEIYVADNERRHGWEEAVAEYGRLEAAFHALEYELCVLPKEGVVKRADFVLQRLEFC